MIRNLLLVLLFCLPALNSFSQSDSLFKGIYVKEGFERYNGTITVLGDTAIKYDEIMLKVSTKISELRSLFTEGIFYPSILFGNNSESGWEKGKPSQGLFDMSVISISIFKEIKLPEIIVKRKRYRMWIWYKSFANPTEYEFDIENDTATATTDLATFVKDAKVTYIRYVTLII